MLLFGEVDDVDVGVWTMDVIPDLKQNHIHVSADIMCVYYVYLFIRLPLHSLHVDILTWS